jgi:hypothetical protein
VYVVHLGPAVQTVEPPSTIAGATVFASNVTVQGAFTSLGIDDNATSTAMTIDSSENVLVNTAVTEPGASNTTTGFSVLSGGGIRASSTYDTAAFNRTGTDGVVVHIRKDGSTVGSIGTANGYMELGSSDTGIRFYTPSDAVIPANPSTNSARDAAIDLGISSQRFKDLYLSGGVYLGGTVAANLLDDYEEGTSIVGISAAAGSGGTISGGSLTWTKIGNQVIVAGNFSISSLGTLSGAFNVTGFPFAASSSFFQSQGAVRSQGIGGSNDIPVVIEIESNTSIARMHFSSGTSTQRIVQTSDLSVGNFLAFGLTYQI